MTITSSAFKKGQAKPAGSGRKKGTLNKTDQAVKDIITETFDRLGGHTCFTAVGSGES